ncbi:MAG: hypothetical protein EBS74_10145, partial [Flavobacteriia bacterium]|nr:hypothetical protein [Flavobacteriia bacterium]
LLLLGCGLLFSLNLNAEQWKPDEKAAVFSIQPDQVLGSPYFQEVLKTYGLIGFGYSNIMRDHHVIDFQKEMGVKIEDTIEVSLVVENFLETIVNLPVSTSGNYNALTNSSMLMIFRTKGEVSPDTFYEKFDRWASGPAFYPSDIDRFRKDARLEAEKIEQMSNARRLRQELYAGMEKSEKVGKTTVFTIPASALDENLAEKGLDKLKISLGMQTEKGETILALGSKEGVLAFFAHENKKASLPKISDDEGFASFSIPMDGEMLKKLESSKLSDPNGPLGPLATTLGEAMYKIEEISGRSKLAGGLAHIDLTLSCENVESAQAIWSVAQASLGMAQLAAMRQQMKNPQNP